jgi:predicted O-methyltransferase YrrM
MSPQKISASKLLHRACRTVPGWCPPGQLLALHTLALSVASLPGDFVEIGSWCGRSAIALGLAARQTPPTRVHCIDLFPSQDDWKQNAAGDYYLAAEISGRTITGNVAHTTWGNVWRSQIAPVYQRWPSAWEAFADSARAFELTDVLAAHKGSIDTFRRTVPRDFQCKLAYIDGSHDEADVRNDIRQIEAMLVPGGWICFDDAFTSAVGVDAAILDLVINGSGYLHHAQLTRKLFVAQRA